MTTTIYPIAIEGEAPEVWATPASASRRLRELFPAPRYALQFLTALTDGSTAAKALKDGIQVSVLDLDRGGDMAAFCQRQFLKGEGTL
jgi:hypothetical protein